MRIIPSECLIFSPASLPRSRLPGAGAGNHLGWETTRTKPAPGHNNHAKHVVREERMSNDLVMVQVSQVDLLIGADSTSHFMGIFTYTITFFPFTLTFSSLSFTWLSVK